MIQRDSFLGQFQEENYTVRKTYLSSQLLNVRLYHTCFTPKNPTRTLALIHGFGEHSGRFYQIAHTFANHGYEVLLIDLTGFGYSGGPRGCATVEVLQNDVITLLSQARPELPLFIYAHSMGGLVTAKLLLDRPNLNVSGCVLTSPFLSLPKDRNISFMKLFIVKHIGDELEDLIINSMVNPTALTKNNKFLHNIFQDRLMIPFLSVKMAKSLFVTVEWIQENEHRFTTPAIVFHGKKDTVVDCEGSRRFVHSKPDPLKQLHLFDNGYHELQHDEEKDQMIERALNFLDKLPEHKIKPAGVINYADFEIKIPKKGKGIKGAAIVVLIGVLIYIIKRLRK